MSDGNERSNGPSDAVNIHRGSNLLGVGQYNERLILQLIRRAGRLSKAQISAMTQLSAQTVSVIINRLLRDKLLRKCEPQREKGKTGKPAVPITLNPGGGYSLGVKIGRRSLDVLLVDFIGNALARISHHYDYPDPDDVFPTVERSIRSIIDDMTLAKRERIVGIGIAAPYALGGWQQAAGAPDERLSRWQNINIRERIAASQTQPVWFSNDATAACIAELEFGKGHQFNNYLYVFVGTFIGGGIVLNGVLYPGSNDNAAALGSMLVPGRFSQLADSAPDTEVQLIHCASRYLLDDQLTAQGLDPDQVLMSIGEKIDHELPSGIGEAVDRWLQATADAIAYASVGAVSVVGFEGVIIDGALPLRIVEKLTVTVQQRLEKMNLEGLVAPRVVAGSIGNDARALGGAILPFYSNFAPDSDVLLNLAAAGPG